MSIPPISSQNGFATSVFPQNVENGQLASEEAGNVKKPSPLVYSDEVFHPAMHAVRAFLERSSADESYIWPNREGVMAMCASFVKRGEYSGFEVSQDMELVNPETQAPHKCDVFFLLKQEDQIAYEEEQKAIRTDRQISFVEHCKRSLSKMFSWRTHAQRMENRLALQKGLAQEIIGKCDAAWCERHCYQNGVLASSQQLESKFQYNHDSAKHGDALILFYSSS